MYPVLTSIFQYGLIVLLHVVESERDWGFGHDQEMSRQHRIDI